MKYISPFTFDIWALQNPPSPNVRLSKGYRIGDIKASAHASHKTHAYISLKQRSNSHNYGLVCNLGKTKPNTSQDPTLTPSNPNQDLLSGSHHSLNQPPRKI